jgi:luciferase family oxidoreductase group 1
VPTTIPISILDFCPVLEGETPREALEQATRLAAHAEKLGYRRFWVAEHHGVPMFASSATAVIISHIASNTRTIRVGAGGIILPNHTPLVVAEQFGTLASLHPDRIDLGLGRAGSREKEAPMIRALRLTHDARERYPSDVAELQSYFRSPVPGQEVCAIPGSGMNVPLWLLGSSSFSAAEAGKLGLPFAFATQFAPHAVGAALEKYRFDFRPSDTLKCPYAMISVLVIAADTDDTAKYLFSSTQITLIECVRGKFLPLQRPVRSLEAVSTEKERSVLERFLPLAIVGSREKVYRELDRLIAETAADELMVLTPIYDQTARFRSFEILAQHEAFVLG